MTHFFEKQDRWGNGLALWVVAAMVFAIPFSLWALTGIELDNEVAHWIPKDNPNYKAWEWYRHHFPTDEAILFSWEGSSLDDPRAAKLVRKIRGEELPDGRYRGGIPHVDRVRTPQELVAQMEKNKIPRDEAISRVKGVLVGAGPLRLLLTDAGRSRKERVKELLQEQARRELGLDLQITVASNADESVAPIVVEEEAENVETVAANEPAGDESTTDDTLLAPVPRHDLVINWRGIHWEAEKVAALKQMALALTFTPANSGTSVTTHNGKPLVAECFQVAGSPIALAIYLSDAGRAERTAAFQALLAACNESGIPPETVHMGGSAVAGNALNREVIRAVWDKSAPGYALHRRSLMLFSGLVGGAIALWMLKSLRLAGLVLGVSYYTMLVSTALVPVTGGTMNMVLVVMPSLLFVTTLSVAIHLANYWQHAAAANLKTAVVDAVKTAWSPCLWAGLTSAIGQASLMTSSLTPVRDFGMYSAIGTLLSLVVTLYGLPALLQVWPGKAPRSEDLDSAFWHGLANWLARRQWAVTTVSLLVSGVCMYGLVHFKTETKVIRYFAESTRTVQDYHFLEDNLGGIIPVDVIVRFDREAQQSSKFLQRRDWVRRIEERMEQLPDISGTLSLCDFLPAVPPPGPRASKKSQLNYNMESRTIENRVRKGEQLGTKNLLTIAQDAGEYNAEGDELWRITAQVAIMSQLDYNDLQKQLDEICSSVLREVSGNSTEKLPASDRNYHPGASHVVTGMIPLFLATQHELLQSFIWSFSGAFGMIALVVMLVMRHPIAGLLAMIPNVLPIGAVFGIIAWSGLAIDIGSTVTASIALGITIDGTLHLITWFRIGIRQGKTRAAAMALALEHCGPAMWQTTLVVSLGLLMLYPSDLILISRFGWLMAALLGAASLTDLFLTPALLAGPLGYIIQKCTPLTTAGEEDTVVREPAIRAEPAGAIAGPHLEKHGMRIRRVD
ncbi:MAG: efflux RND transporter permease subunit [Planctomycetaceae bacterium]